MQCSFLSQLSHFNDQLLLQSLGGSIQTSWDAAELAGVLIVMLLVLTVWKRRFQVKEWAQLSRKRTLVVVVVAIGGLLYWFNPSIAIRRLKQCSGREIGFTSISPDAQSYSPCQCSVPEEFQGAAHHFVEIGADNGLFLSNSYFFEKNAGWKGMCVEPRPPSYKELVKNRPDCINVNALISNTPGSLKFFSFGQGTWHRQMSGLVGSNAHTANQDAARAYAAKENVELEEFDIPTLRFADLFQKHGFDRIEAAFVDVEGAELQVLQTIEFDAVKIHYFVLEQAGPKIMALLSKNGFARMHQPLSMDTWFVNTNW